MTIQIYPVTKSPNPHPASPKSDIRFSINIKILMSDLGEVPARAEGVR